MPRAARIVPSRRFSVTLAQSDLDKAHIENAIYDYCKSYLVAEEKHTADGIHHHIYLRTTEKKTLAQVREYFLSNVLSDDGNSINIQKTKSERNWLKYCTKEDSDCIYKDVKTSDFAFHWHLVRYCKNNEHFDELHSFITGHLQQIRNIRDVHSKYWEHEYRRRNKDRRSAVTYNLQVPWVQLLFDHFLAGRNIYLYGTTGRGKSIAIREMCRHNRTTYLPCGLTQFEFSNVFSSLEHIIAGDAGPDYVQTHRATILQLCDGQETTINVKFERLRTVFFQGSFIILSNFPPHDDNAFLRRFAVVEADQDGFQPALPQEAEVQEGPQTQTIREVSEAPEQEAVEED